MTPPRVAVTGRTDGPRPTCGVPRTRDALRSLHGRSTGDAAWTQCEWESLFQAQPPEPAGRLRPSTSSCGFAQVRRPEPNSRTLAELVLAREDRRHAVVGEDVEDRLGEKAGD